MKIIIRQPIASRAWAFRAGDIIDADEFITEQEALNWLNAGIAEAVKVPRKRKQEVS